MTGAGPAPCVVGRNGDTRSRVAAGPALRRSGRDADRAPGGLLLLGSSRFARHHQLFPGSTAARIPNHLPAPMVVVPRPVQDKEAAS